MVAVETQAPPRESIKKNRRKPKQEFNLYQRDYSGGDGGSRSTSRFERDEDEIVAAKREAAMEKKRRQKEYEAKRKIAAARLMQAKKKTGLEDSDGGGSGGKSVISKQNSDMSAAFVSFFKTLKLQLLGDDPNRTDQWVTEQLHRRWNKMEQKKRKEWVGREPPGKLEEEEVMAKVYETRRSEGAAGDHIHPPSCPSPSSSSCSSTILSSRSEGKARQRAEEQERCGNVRHDDEDGDEDEGLLPSYARIREANCNGSLGATSNSMAYTMNFDDFDDSNCDKVDYVGGQGEEAAGEMQRGSMHPPLPPLDDVLAPVPTISGGSATEGVPVNALDLFSFNDDDDDHLGIGASADGEGGGGKEDDRGAKAGEEDQSCGHDDMQWPGGATSSTATSSTTITSIDTCTSATSTSATSANKKEELQEAGR